MTPSRKPLPDQRVLDFEFANRQIDGLDLDDRERDALKAVYHLARADRRSCVASVPALARQMGCGEARLENGIAGLQEAGLLERTYRPGQTARLVINWPAIIDPDDSTLRWDSTAAAEAPPRYHRGTTEVPPRLNPAAAVEWPLDSLLPTLLQLAQAFLQQLAQVLQNQPVPAKSPPPTTTALAIEPAPTAAPPATGNPGGTAVVAPHHDHEMNDNAMHGGDLIGGEEKKSQEKKTPAAPAAGIPTGGYTLHIEQGELQRPAGVDAVFRRYLAAGVLQEADHDDFRAFARAVVRMTSPSRLLHGEGKVHSVGAYARSCLTGGRWKLQIKSVDRATSAARPATNATELVAAGADRGPRATSVPTGFALKDLWRNNSIPDQGLSAP